MFIVKGLKFRLFFIFIPLPQSDKNVKQFNIP